jgi:hypothetical protein
MATSLNDLPKRMDDLRQLRAQFHPEAPIDVTVQVGTPEKSEVDRYEAIGVDRLVVYPFDRSRDPVACLAAYAARTGLNGGR